MKKLFLWILIPLLIIQCKEKNSIGIKITGHVKNANREYVTLAIAPKTKGALNFDGFKSVGDRMDENGNFKLCSNKVTNGSNYSLWCNGSNLNLVLFDGDDLKLEFDIQKIDSTFIKGKGAGKNNVLNLEQFRPKYQYNFDFKMGRLKEYMDSIVSLQSKLVDAIFQKDTNCKEISNAANRDIVNKIITETPLSQDEYHFLKQMIIANKYSLAGYPAYLCNHNLADSIPINFSDSYFDFFNEQEFKKTDIISNEHFSICIDDILQMEYVRKKQKVNPELTYRDWNFMQGDSLYWAQRLEYLKEIVKPEVYDNFCAEELSSTLNLGFYEDYNRDKTKFFNSFSNSKYVNRFKGFENLLSTGLNNTDYNLGDPAYSLNDESYKHLIENHKGKNIYLVLWTSQFAEVGVIPFLPALLDIEKECKAEIKVINICIDKAKNKSFWAAKIIDNAWKGNHYFFPIKSENDSIVHKLKCSNIFSYCDGGVTYKLIDKNGNMLNDFDSPQQLTKEKMLKYLNNTVR